jgi:hypothetical protein
MPSDKETIENLYNLLRAVVFKFGRDVTVTKDEFMQSLGGSLSIQPRDDVTYLRIWSLHSDVSESAQ